MDYIFYSIANCTLNLISFFEHHKNYECEGIKKIKQKTLKNKKKALKFIKQALVFPIVILLYLFEVDI